jgi:hypothetical protein
MIILYMFRAPVIIYVDNVVIGDNNKCCAASSCSSNSIKHDTAYLWYAIRNDCSFDSNRVEYSLNGTYQSSNTFSGLAPNDSLYVRNTTDATCVTMSSSLTTINTVPLPPAVPTASATVQPTCATPSGTITITTQSGVEYSVNGTHISPRIHLQLAPGSILYMSETLLTQVA